MNKTSVLQLIRLEHTSSRLELVLSSGGLGSERVGQPLSDKIATIMLTNPPDPSKLDFKVGDFYEIEIKRVEAPNKEKSNG